MSKYALPVFVALILAFLLAPIVVVVISSFNAVGVLSFPPHGFTTRWYGQIDPSFGQAFLVSLEVAAIATAIAVVAGVPAALALARGSFPGRNVLNALCLSPLMVPALVTGVALFQFSLVVWDEAHLTVGGTISGLVLGHLTFAIPFVIRAVLAAHSRVDFSLEEAARNLGASSLRTFLAITLPDLRPSILSGAVFAFLMSLDEVPIALFMGGGDATPLPVKLFTAVEISFGGDILAVAALVVAVSAVLMLLVDRLIGLERLFVRRQ